MVFASTGDFDDGWVCGGVLVEEFFQVGSAFFCWKEGEDLYWGQRLRRKKEERKKKEENRSRNECSKGCGGECIGEKRFYQPLAQSPEQKIHRGIFLVV